VLPQDRAEQIIALSKDGVSGREIARLLGHSPATVRSYVNGQTIPGSRAPSLRDKFTGVFADYCRQRLADDPHLQCSMLLSELADLGFKGSRATFYRGLTSYQLLPPARRRSQMQDDGPLENASGAPVTARAFRRPPPLPISVAPVTGETIASYLTRLAAASHITLAEVLAVLPSWFSTKARSSDDRIRHHMLVPAEAESLDALARLSGASPDSLARALPAFAVAGNVTPDRTAFACRRCTARRGIRAPVPVRLPAHRKLCTRHGVWLGDADQPSIDLATCQDIIIAQHRAIRLLRRCTPQQLLLACQTAAKALVLTWPSSPAAIPQHWRYRLLVLQTANQRTGPPPEHDAYRQAAIYPDIIAGAADELRNGIKAQLPGPK
jgi:predicted transcriptional regulator